MNTDELSLHSGIATRDIHITQCDRSKQFYVQILCIHNVHATYVTYRLGWAKKRNITVPPQFVLHCVPIKACFVRFEYDTQVHINILDCYFLVNIPPVKYHMHGVMLDATTPVR